MKELNGFLPGPWSHGNPVDVLGDADAARYGHAFEAAAKDPNSDGILLILTPQDMTDATGSAQQLALKASNVGGKPDFGQLDGRRNGGGGRNIFTTRAFPCSITPTPPLKYFARCFPTAQPPVALRNAAPFRGPRRTGGGPEKRRGADSNARSAGRTVLTEEESKRLLALYGIPTVETRLATTADEAAREADALGYPIVLKLHSKTITHKSDVGGVLLNLRDAVGVRRAFDTIRKNVEALKGPGHFDGVTVQRMIRWEGHEVILGASPDPQFGPMLLFGTGGKLVEIYQDKALGLPPLTSTLARRMMAKTKIWKALQGVRGQKISDLAALEKVMIRFSWLVLNKRPSRKSTSTPFGVARRRDRHGRAGGSLHGRRKRRPGMCGRPFVRTPSLTTNRSRPKTATPSVPPGAAGRRTPFVDFHAKVSEKVW
jgi:acetyltransferase